MNFFLFSLYFLAIMATRRVQFLEMAIFIFPLGLGDPSGFVIVDWSTY
jgi:hypothetical protein